MSGFVYLVGAGPGDPGLLTVAGAAAIRKATAIVHDALVGDGILAQARSDAKRYDVGKRAGRHNLTQDEINMLLIELAREEQTVVRLKGGDPFLFGRGAEEAAALARVGIPFRVIPGVTSAIAVPASAGIPVTHRGVAASLGIVTAHREDGAGSPDWHALAQLDTVVVLMGAERLDLISQNLIRAGRSADTPVACIQSGTLDQQRQVIATLGNMVERVQGAGLGAPMIVIVGNVVNVREQLAFCECTVNEYELERNIQSNLVR